MSDATTTAGATGERGGSAPAGGAGAGSPETARAEAPAGGPGPTAGKAGKGRGDTSGGAKRGAPGAGEVALGKYVTIDTTQRLDGYDRPSARAYAANDSRATTQAVYALICDSTRPARLDALGPINRVRGVPLVTPVDWGPVDWAPKGGGPGERRYALIFELPKDPPLVASPDAAIAPMREEQIVERVVAPLVKVLRELDGRGLTHRAISLDNLFGTEGNGAPMMLGECVSAPAGMLQPTVYEPIDSAQALPAGRGHGTLADDLYALGVLMAILVRGGDPTLGMRPHDMIASKIERGSYATLIDRARVSLTLMEPLRGLLCDRVEERWDVDDLEQWLGGRHQSPKQPSLPQKARRGFPFAGRDHWTCPGLAHALATNWSEALHKVADGELEQWTTRSLSDEKHARMVQAVLAASRADDGGGEDRTLARTLIALDPAAPVRMRDFAARIDALAQLLAVDYQDTQRRNEFVRALRAKLPQRWLEAQPKQRGDHPQAIQQFERMTWYLDRDQPGYGLERVLYEFNDGWPCQSPLIASSYVNDVADLLPALEARAEQDIPDQPPVDRHIAAFCGANMSPSPERLMQGLGHAKPDYQAHAMLSLLADLQRRYGPERLPVLTEWTARHIAVLSESLRNRELREKVERRIKRAVQAGSLTELRVAVADQEVRRRDARGFAAAKAHHAQAAKEIAWLEDGGLTSDSHIAWATRGVAMAISAVCSGLLVVLLTVFYVS